MEFRICWIGMVRCSKLLGGLERPAIAGLQPCTRACVGCGVRKECYQLQGGPCPSTTPWLANRSKNILNYEYINVHDQMHRISRVCGRVAEGYIPEGVRRCTPCQPCYNMRTKHSPRCQIPACTRMSPDQLTQPSRGQYRHDPAVPTNVSRMCPTPRHAWIG